MTITSPLVHIYGIRKENIFSFESVMYQYRDGGRGTRGNTSAYINWKQAIKKDEK